MAPEAPARFSTITGCPVLSESLAPTPRAMRSSATPGANGATRRMGLLGKPCARALDESAASMNRRILDIASPQVRVPATVQLLVRIAHGVGPRLAEHNLE